MGSVYDSVMKEHWLEQATEDRFLAVVISEPEAGI
jgi:hypothetical protein